jgi:uncharacterized membrane protein YbhN (UPF0104 family)
MIARRRQLWILAWVVATGLIVLLARSVNAGALIGVVEHVDMRWLAFAVWCNLLIQPCGALQWRALLPPAANVPRARMLRLFSLTSVANNTTPSLIGHVTGAVLLSGEPGVGRAGAVSLLALDQICVGAAKIVVLVAASVLLPVPEWMHRGLIGLAILVASLVMLATIVSRRTRHLEVLRDPRRIAVGFGFALLVKIAEACAILSVQHAFALPVTASSVLAVLAASALGSVVPLAPAGIGTYEAAAFAAYRFMGLPPATALGIAAVQHVCQLLPAVLPGYLLLSLPGADRAPSPLTD